MIHFAFCWNAIACANLGDDKVLTKWIKLCSSTEPPNLNHRLCAGGWYRDLHVELYINRAQKFWMTDPHLNSLEILRTVQRDNVYLSVTTYYEDLIKYTQMTQIKRNKNKVNVWLTIFSYTHIKICIWKITSLKTIGRLHTNGLYLLSFFLSFFLSLFLSPPLPPPCTNEY